MKSCINEFNNQYYTIHDHYKKLISDIIKYQIDRIILECRFGCKISIRNIHKIINGYYSIGYIHNLCNKSAQKAEKIMSEINKHTDKKCITAILDETFPKVVERIKTRIAVLVDECGLIRGIDIMPNKNREKKLVNFLKSCISLNYNPKYLLTDYDKIYPIAAKKVFGDIMIYKDFVHSIRQILKYVKSGMKGIHTTVNTSVKITKKKQKDMNSLKKKLLKKRLNVVMEYLYKGFNSNNVSIGSLYLEGFLSELEILSNKFNSLLPIYEKSKKFINKYLDTWNQQMQSYYYDSIPLTSNIVESKNSIFKAFSKKVKSLSKKNLKSYYCALALYENYDIKERGVNKGTNAMARAEVNLKKLGAKNFFDAVGLKKPNYDSIQADTSKLININKLKQIAA
jgi:mRNA-degrading endonuclease RelE of RelBE toxin-antitoxin system